MRRAAATGLAAALVALAACGPERSGASVEELWQAHCARCHGEDGRGLRALRGLEPGLDLTRSAMVSSRDRRRLYRRIAAGSGTMPGFSHKLPQGDLELLVEFVERFATTR
jgi:mono/diheme cytochrome c family protein